MQVLVFSLNVASGPSVVYFSSSKYMSVTIARICLFIPYGSFSSFILLLLLLPVLLLFLLLLFLLFLLLRLPLCVLKLFVLTEISTPFLGMNLAALTG